VHIIHADSPVGFVGAAIKRISVVDVPHYPADNRPSQSCTCQRFYELHLEPRPYRNSRPRVCDAFLGPDPIPPQARLRTAPDAHCEFTINCVGKVPAVAGRSTLKPFQTRHLQVLVLVPFRIAVLKWGSRRSGPTVPRPLALLQLRSRPAAFSQQVQSAPRNGIRSDAQLLGRNVPPPSRRSPPHRNRQLTSFQGLGSAAFRTPAIPRGTS